MSQQSSIPVFALFGETEHFPDVLHFEKLSDRAQAHDWRIGAHRHSHISQLFAFEKGEFHIRLDDAQYTAKEGSFLYIPPQVVHEFSFEPDSVGEVVSFPNIVLNAIRPTSAELSGTLSKCLTGAMDTSLKRHLKDLHAAYISQGPFRDQRIVSLAHFVLTHIAESAATDSPTGITKRDPRITKLDKLIAEHMASGWTARDYASALSLTTGHLSRICRDASGHGTTTYIENAIMAEACRLLAFTQLPVAEIGFRIGFTDPSYFSKRFRLFQKQTPSEYRATFET